jgi:two-component system, NarL family, nitrate/nitrite response regulator NarL
MRQTISTVIVGASTLWREGLIRILKPAGFYFVGSKPSMSEVELEQFPESDPCLLIIECNDSAQSLIAHITAVKKRIPLVRIALLGHHWVMSEIAAAFQAGANAYFTEATASDEFVNAIGLIMSGHQAILPIELASSPSDTEQQSQSPRVYFSKPLESDQGAPSGPLLHLSPRETSILRCLARGASNKLIAREIKISEATVKIHVKVILRRIGATNRTQAAVWAMTNAAFSSGESRMCSRPSHPPGREKSHSP